MSALQTISAVVAGRGVLQRNYKLDEHRIDREVEFVSGGIEDQILGLFASSDAVTSLLEGARNGGKEGAKKCAKVAERGTEVHMPKRAKTSCHHD